MQDVLLALVTIAAGTLFCFAGFLAFRLVIPLWAAFVGFVRTPQTTGGGT